MEGLCFFQLRLTATAALNKVGVPSRQASNITGYRYSIEYSRSTLGIETVKLGLDVEETEDILRKIE